MATDILKTLGTEAWERKNASLTMHSALGTCSSSEKHLRDYYL